MNNFKHEVALPHFKADDVIGSHTYSRTLRQNGFRLQQQNLEDKSIFHNYGQGDAEVSLAYGCSYIISKIITVRQDATKIKQVAVVGDGINALMTCLQLLKRGYKVTLYAKKVPIKRSPTNTKIVQAQEGLQFWYPGGYDNCDPLKHELVAKLSFEFLKECSMANRYQSLKWISCYCSGPKVEQLKQQVTSFINNQISNIQVGFGVQKIEQFTCYKSMLIDTELFMEEIYTELKLRNIIVVEKEFKTISDIKSLKQQYIFNCLGIENKQIFGDSSVQELKGFYVSINKKFRSSPDAFAIWMSSEIQKEQDFVISISGSKMQVSSRGLITQTSMKQITDNVLARAYHFIKERTLKPFKL